MQSLSQSKHVLTGLINPERISKRQACGKKRQVEHQGYKPCVYSYYAIEYNYYHLFYLLSKENQHDHKHCQECFKLKVQLRQLKAIVSSTEKHSPSPDLLLPLCSSYHCCPAQAAERNLLGTYTSLSSSPQHLPLITQSCSSPAYLSSPFFLLILKALFARCFLLRVH